MFDFDYSLARIQRHDFDIAKQTFEAAQPSVKEYKEELTQFDQKLSERVAQFQAAEVKEFTEMSLDQEYRGAYPTYLKLEDAVLKAGTLISSFTILQTLYAPVVRDAVELERLERHPALKESLLAVDAAAKEKFEAIGAWIKSLKEMHGEMSTRLTAVGWNMQKLHHIVYDNKGAPIGYASLATTYNTLRGTPMISAPREMVAAPVASSSSNASLGLIPVGSST